jgi:hypothetical protein
MLQVNEQKRKTSTFRGTEITAPPTSRRFSK